MQTTCHCRRLAARGCACTIGPDASSRDTRVKQADNDSRSAIANLRDRSIYKRWVTIPIRFADQDPVGHVNNAAIAIYFEQARCELLLPLVAEHGRGKLDIVLARIEIDYLREIRYPGTVDVGIRISRLGTKSIRLESAVFADGICRATAVATIVVFDLATRGSAVPPPALRGALEAQI